MILDERLEKGMTCAFDVAGTLETCHPGTLTVELIDWKERCDASPLATVRSMQTGEIFTTAIGHLTDKEQIVQMAKYYETYENPATGIYANITNSKIERIKKMAFCMQMPELA
jgi:hypothetical protein